MQGPGRHSHPPLWSLLSCWSAASGIPFVSLQDQGSEASEPEWGPGTCGKAGPLALGSAALRDL